MEKPEEPEIKLRDRDTGRGRREGGRGGAQGKAIIITGVWLNPN